jgi:hypothetical protein
MNYITPADVLQEKAERLYKVLIRFVYAESYARSTVMLCEIALSV